jgi:hypothetical protein
MLRRPASVLVLAVAVGGPAGALADEPCEEKHLSAQRMRARGELVSARKALLECASASCPRLVQADCVKWLEEVEAELPTVLLSVKDPDGADVGGARVTMDGRALDGALDGRAFPVDPGQHRFVFEAPGFDPRSVDALVQVGAKNLAVAASLDRADAVPRGDDTAGLVFVLTLGGLGAASLLTFAGLAIAGEVEFRDLEDTCAPRCSQEDADAVRTKFIAADVMLGVGVASAAGAVIGYLVAFELAPDAGARSGGAVRFGVGPGTDGAGAWLRARF